MARKTTTTEPKVHTLTNEQLQTLKDVASDLQDIRRTLEDLEGVEDLSVIMFKVGAMYNLAETVETTMDELLESYEEECDECDDNF